MLLVLNSFYFQYAAELASYAQAVRGSWPRRSRDDEVETVVPPLKPPIFKGQESKSLIVTERLSWV
jgi:hypothetical protein